MNNNSLPSNGSFIAREISGGKFHSIWNNESIPKKFVKNLIALFYREILALQQNNIVSITNVQLVISKYCTRIRFDKWFITGRFRRWTFSRQLPNFLATATSDRIKDATGDLPGFVCDMAGKYSGRKFLRQSFLKEILRSLESIPRHWEL